ncbi:hypothetical protein ACQEU3_17495 [Spirillospora sp. CA-253888]
MAVYEAEAAHRAGVPADRRALFGHYLSDAGLAELGELLDSGRYEVQMSEEAVLPVVAWLIRAGDVAIVRAALEDVVEGAGIAAPHRGLLRSAVNAMVAKRRHPGSQRLAALRTQQREIAERPTRWPRSSSGAFPLFPRMWVWTRIAALKEVAESALQGCPATSLPDPLVRGWGGDARAALHRSGGHWMFDVGRSLPQPP